MSDLSIERSIAQPTSIGHVLESLPSELNEKLEESIYYSAFLSRRVEEALLDLFKEGWLSGTVHTCIGQEFSGAILAENLSIEDSIFSNHRCHGHFLSTRKDSLGLIAEIMGREIGVCAGRGGSQHLYKDRFYSNGIQGGGTPIAVGVALANKIRKSKNIAVSFIGDGTLGEGILYESLNIASVFSAPILFVLEDNGYAQSTKQTETLAGDIRARAASFNIIVEQGTTWDWRNLYFIAKELIEKIRKENQPGFLIIKTYRLKAHSKGDDDRSREEVEVFEKRDPLNLLVNSVNPKILAIQQKVLDEVSKSVDLAKRSKVADLFIPRSSYSFPPLKPKYPEAKRLIKALNSAFIRIMNEDKEVIFIGEDVKDPYGGAFKASLGLTDRFPDRVFNMPISESAIIGLGTGLALENFKPIIEIMFGDFLSLGLDQLLNHAAKFPYMFNQQVKTGVIVRTPMGGHRGYGPTHSQTLDKHFLGIPGLNVLALNNFIDPFDIYSTIINTASPFLVIENKILYTTDLVCRESLPKEYLLEYNNEDIPAIRIYPSSEQSDLTLLAYGFSAYQAYELIDSLFEEHDIICQLICPTILYPFNLKAITSWIKESKKIYIIEEGQIFSGFGAEVAAQMFELDLAYIPLKRIGPASIPIPAGKELEQQTLVTKEQIISTILEDFKCKFN